MPPSPLVWKHNPQPNYSKDQVQRRNRSLNKRQEKNWLEASYCVKSFACWQENYVEFVVKNFQVHSDFFNRDSEPELLCFLNRTHPRHMPTRQRLWSSRLRGVLTCYPPSRAHPLAISLCSTQHRGTLCELQGLLILPSPDVVCSTAVNPSFCHLTDYLHFSFSKNC